MSVVVGRKNSLLDENNNASSRRRSSFQPSIKHVVDEDIMNFMGDFKLDRDVNFDEFLKEIGKNSFSILELVPTTC